MPAKTKKQERFMQMCAHSPQKARGKCPSRSDARKVLGFHAKKKGRGR